MRVSESLYYLYIIVKEYIIDIFSEKETFVRI